jgi:hypothetical protein
MKATRWLVLVVLAMGVFSVVACGDDSNKNDLLSISDCKNSTGGDGIVSGLVTPITSADYYGLFCISYAVNGSDSVAVDVINWWANCMGDYEGSVITPDDHTLEFERWKSDCSVEAGCDCPFDLSFEASGVAPDADLTISLLDRSCLDGSLFCAARTVLPLATAASGVVCRYGGGDMEEERGLYENCIMPEDGGVEPEDGEVEGMCSGDLVCTEIEGLDYPVCLMPCETTSDCPAPDVLACEDGLCRLVDPLPSTCEP